MQWAAKEKFFLVTIVSSLLIGTGTFFAMSSSSDATLSVPTVTCFETSTAIISQERSANCAAGEFLLGSKALVENRTESGTVIELNPFLLARFNAAKIVAEREGVELYITSGYRTYERQGQLFAEEVEKRGSETEAAKWVLPPQYSHHPEGLAIDVNYPGDPDGAKWLELNGARFGLCRVYANEWWHFEGVIAPGEKCPAMAPNALVDLAR